MSALEASYRNLSPNSISEKSVRHLTVSGTTTFECTRRRTVPRRVHSKHAKNFINADKLIMITLVRLMDLHALLIRSELCNQERYGADCPTETGSQTVLS